MMAWFTFNRLLTFLERIMCVLLRWISPAFRAMLRYTLTAISWVERQVSSTSESEGTQPEELPPEQVHGEKDDEVGPAGPHLARKAPGRGEGDADEFGSEQYRVPTTDQYYCDWDSSWETEETEETEETQEPEDFSWPRAASSSYKFKRFQGSSKDMQNYRHDYPVQPRSWCRTYPVSEGRPNYDFYVGLIPSSPDNVYISQFHEQWFGMYEKLERVHTYIQWLFPLPEQGMNSEATPLTKEEIQAFQSSSTAKDNLLKSYKLMLDFYGIELCDVATGKVRRSGGWKDRFNNLNSHSHNNLRITRILKCLGILGFDHYQVPLVDFFLNETLVNGELPNVQESVLNYFLFAVRDKKERRRLIKFAYMHYNPNEEFIWCPKKLQRMWLPEQQRGMDGLFWYEQ